MSYDFDLFVIGGGSGGVRCARIAAGHGARVGIVLEPGMIRVPLAVRGEEAIRRSAVDLGRVPVALPGGGTVLLSQVADIREEGGPVQVVREDAQRFQTVQSNVRGRDLVGFVDEARAAVAEHVPLSQGYSLVWGGQFENQQRATARLAGRDPGTNVAAFRVEADGPAPASASTPARSWTKAWPISPSRGSGAPTT